VNDAARAPRSRPRLPAGAAAWLDARGFAVRSRRPLAGDVGARRYWRLALAGGGSAVLAVYPPAERPACRRFLATGELLAGAGVRVPAVLASDCDRGRAVVEDLGPVTVYDLRRRPWPEVAPYFEAAARAARRIAALPPDAVAALSPPLDGALLRRELTRTWEEFLAPRGLVAGEFGARLAAALDALCTALGAAAPAPCHRDLMVRNLVPLGAAEVGVLDHQDLRLGPPLYDLASLLNDSLFPPAVAEAALLDEHAPGAAARLAYHRAAAQRTLKAVGTYAAFARRGGRRHLRLIAPTLARALVHLAAAPETAAVAPEAARRWRRAAGRAAAAGPPAGDLLH
jgi:hypothetical protein